jgi:hypothetical protein
VSIYRSQATTEVNEFTAATNEHAIVEELSSQNQSYITTDNQLASPFWCQAPIWDPRPMFLLEILFEQLRVCYFVAPSLTRGRACNLLLSYRPVWMRPFFIRNVLYQVM